MVCVRNLAEDLYFIMLVYIINLIRKQQFMFIKLHLLLEMYLYKSKEA